MKSISPWLSTTMYLLLISTPLSAQEVFFVDPNGNDSNSGTRELPLRTFQTAVQKVRTVVDGSGDIVVNFNTGTYLFSDTVVLGPADSGTANQSITYRATPGQSPVFSSLIQVTGWSPFDDNIMQAPLPQELSHVRYLQDASENWMERSATEAFSAQDEPSFCIECTWDEPQAQAKKIECPVSRRIQRSGLVLCRPVRPARVHARSDAGSLADRFGEYRPETHLHDDSRTV